MKIMKFQNYLLDTFHISNTQNTKYIQTVINRYIKQCESLYIAKSKNVYDDEYLDNLYQDILENLHEGFHIYSKKCINTITSFVDSLLQTIEKNYNTLHIDLITDTLYDSIINMDRINGQPFFIKNFESVHIEYCNYIHNYKKIVNSLIDHNFKSWYHIKKIIPNIVDLYKSKIDSILEKSSNNKRFYSYNDGYSIFIFYKQIIPKNIKLIEEKEIELIDLCSSKCDELEDSCKIELLVSVMENVIEYTNEIYKYLYIELFNILEDLSSNSLQI